MDPPAKESAREELRRKRKIVQELLHLETEAQVAGALRYWGIPERSNEWIAALAAWREYQRQRF